MSRKALTIAVVCLAVILVGLLAAALLLKNAPAEPAASQNTQTTVQPTATEPAETTVAPTQPTQEETTAPTEEATLPVIPEVKPGVVGLYIPAEDGTKGRKLVTLFECKRVAKQDIDCFEVLASQDDYVSGSSFSGMWKKAWEDSAAEENSKVGFHIQFDLNDETSVSRTILKPSDAKDFYDYLEIYLYDDIHQTPGVWYTHLEDGDMGEETVISSIKLTSGAQIDQVGDITLTAFVYQGEDCFDENGAYIADVLYTVAIPG